MVSRPNQRGVSFAARRMKDRSTGRRHGLTLLELVLALGLSVIIMGAIGMAVHLHLRTLNIGTTDVEQAQLARAVLRMIADDLRSAVPRETQEIPAAVSIIPAAPSQQEGDGIDGDNGDGDNGDVDNGGGDNGGGDNGGGDGSGGDGGTGAGGQQGGGGGQNGQYNESSGAGGSPNDEGDASLAAGADDALDEADSDEPLNIAESVVVENVVGLFGNQYELQFDLSRVPRVDQYTTFYSADPTINLVDIPSDVKTVAYYLRTQPSMYAGGMSFSGGQSFVEDSGDVGLVRRELDRAVTLWAATNNNLQGIEQVGKLIAPEVTYLEFRYFDGYEWLIEWDSEELGGLPLAVEIVISVRSARNAESLTNNDLSLVNPLNDPTGDPVYRLVVWMPGANRDALEEAAEEALAL